MKHMKCYFVVKETAQGVPFILAEPEARGRGLPDDLCFKLEPSVDYSAARDLVDTLNRSVTHVGFKTSAVP